MHQAVNVCHTPIVRDAWKNGQALTVQGWIYSLADGLLRNTGICASRIEDVEASYLAAVASSASDFA